MGRYLDLANQALALSGSEVVAIPTRPEKTADSKDFPASPTPIPSTRAASDAAEQRYDINDINDQRYLAPDFGRFCRNPGPAPADGNPATWRAWFNALADRRAMIGSRTLAEALPLAYGEAQSVWHRLHSALPPRGECAGCGGRLVEESAILSLPDGAAVHDVSCLIEYGRRWRSAAAAGLAELGIIAPEGWDF